MPICELLNCGVIVHAGNAGMAMAGIAAGIPQVMIRTQLPHALQVVEKRTLCLMIGVYVPG
jgi:hypothetical protein